MNLSTLAKVSCMFGWLLLCSNGFTQNNPKLSPLAKKQGLTLPNSIVVRQASSSTSMTSDHNSVKIKVVYQLEPDEVDDFLQSNEIDLNEVKPVSAAPSGMFAGSNISIFGKPNRSLWPSQRPETGQYFTRAEGSGKQVHMVVTNSNEGKSLIYAESIEKKAPLKPEYPVGPNKAATSSPTKDSYKRHNIDGVSMTLPNAPTKTAVPGGSLKSIESINMYRSVGTQGTVNITKTDYNHDQLSIDEGVRFKLNSLKKRTGVSKFNGKKRKRKVAGVNAVELQLQYMNKGVPMLRDDLSFRIGRSIWNIQVSSTNKSKQVHQAFKQKVFESILFSN